MKIRKWPFWPIFTMVSLIAVIVVVEVREGTTESRCVSNTLTCGAPKISLHSLFLL